MISTQLWPASWGHQNVCIFVNKQEKFHRLWKSQVSSFSFTVTFSPFVLPPFFNDYFCYFPSIYNSFGVSVFLLLSAWSPCCYSVGGYGWSRIIFRSTAVCYFFCFVLACVFIFLQTCGMNASERTNCLLSLCSSSVPSHKPPCLCSVVHTCRKVDVKLKFLCVFLMSFSRHYTLSDNGLDLLISRLLLHIFHNPLSLLLVDKVLSGSQRLIEPLKMEASSVSEGEVQKLKSLILLCLEQQIYGLLMWAHNCRQGL